MQIDNGFISGQGSLRDVLPVAGFTQSQGEVKTPGVMMTGVWGLLNSPTQTKTTDIGNVIFFSDGKPVVTFYEIPDPQGVVDLVIGMQKSTGHTTAGSSQVVKETIVKEVVMIPCSYCRSLMSQTSVFCPNCGARRKA